MGQGEASFLVQFAHICGHLHQHATVHVDQILVDPYGPQLKPLNLCISLGLTRRKKLQKVVALSVVSKAGHTLDGSPAGLAFGVLRFVHNFKKLHEHKLNTTEVHLCSKVFFALIETLRLRELPRVLCCMVLP